VIRNESLTRLANDSVRIEILPLGASLHRFEVRLADGTWRNIVLGYPNLDGYRTARGKLGMSIGRYANRIAGARFNLVGVDYPLDANEAPNQLHGGSGGFHTHLWEVTGHGTDWVELTLLSPDGDQGFPGELTVTTRYHLIPGGAQVTYHAVTTASTVVNMTTHPYFNLNGEGSGATDRHALVINASRYTPTSRDGIPTGEIRDVSGSALDFRSGPLLGQARDAAVDQGIARKGGFDHNLVVDGQGLRELCRLTGEDGLTLVMQSDQPALQLYGGSHFDDTQIGTSGHPYPPYAGVALEPQNYPDAPNHPNFPSSVLNPGQEYTSTTRWLIS
jgi:aldose 1-epimerase